MLQWWILWRGRTCKVITVVENISLLLEHFHLMITTVYMMKTVNVFRLTFKDLYTWVIGKALIIHTILMTQTHLLLVVKSVQL